MRAKTAAVSGFVLGLVGVGVGVAAGAAPAWADCCPVTGSAMADPHLSVLGSTLAPVSSALASDPPPVLPETPFAALLPLGAVAVGALALARQRRRWGAGAG